ncbi:hypothetical protein Tco_1500354 [Tanacetum coccineum]
MSEEDQNVEVILPVKSDMHSYSSTMTAKDVKALAFKHNIPLDLHPVALTAEWTMDKLTDDFIVSRMSEYLRFSLLDWHYRTGGNILIPKLFAIKGKGKPVRLSKKRAERKRAAVDSTDEASSRGDHADGAESSRPGSVYIPEWTIHQRSRVDTPKECRELLTHLAPPAAREEMNAYGNNTAMERAWFSIARGALAQTDALLRFEARYDAHSALKERCEDVTKQLVSTRTDFTHASNLYNTLSNRYQQVRGEHAGCAEKLINAERERDELRVVNIDQDSQIKELEAELARKDSALVFSDRVSNERAVENESLVLNRTLKKEKIDSIEALPTVVGGQSLVEASDKTSWTYEGDKISGLPRRTVQEILKMYPAPPPPHAPTKVNPSSQAPDGSKSVPEGANV